MRAIEKEVTVGASIADVWQAWTTGEGGRGFFAPEARIEARAGGAFELLFMADAPSGSRGSEGCTIVEIEPVRRLSFTWNFPPHLSIRGEHTRVDVLFATEAASTRVSLRQTGWREGPDWDAGFAYFERAWGLVLERLRRRFATGPIDWKQDDPAWVELTAADGHVLAAYRSDPEGKARGGVVVIQEIFGVNDHIRDVVDRFAAGGYLAIAPAMYDRAERNYQHGYTPEDVTRGREVRAKIAPEALMMDVSAAVHAVAGAGNVGVVGYCWGGFVTWMAAAHMKGLACAVPYYGSGILDHADLVPRCPVMAHFGDKDAMIPAHGVRALAAKHRDHDIHVYPADHGFNCDRRGSYDADAAALARERTVAFFGTHIG